MDKENALKIMINAACLYRDNFVGKKLLVVFGDEMKPDFIEIKASGENFIHLAGVKTSIAAGDFYSRLLDKRVSKDDFSFKEDGTSELKLSVIESILNIKSSAQMFGDYNGGKPKLFTRRLMGNISACIGFVPAGSTYFVPNTILKGDIRDYIPKGKQRVFVILAKSLKAVEYDHIVKVAKKICSDDILAKITLKVKIADSILCHDRNKAAEGTSGDLTNNMQ